MTLIKVLFFLLIPLIPLAGQEGFRIHPYIQNPAPDGMSIIWFSSDSIPGLFSFGKSGFPQGTESYSIPERAVSLGYSHWEDSVFFNGKAPEAPFRHRIRVHELEPYTSYHYTVAQGMETYKSDFRTSPMGDTAIRFMVYGDAETEPESTGNHTTWIDPVSRIWRRYIFDQTTGYKHNLQAIANRDPDLVIIAGDLVQHGGERRDWDEFWRHNTHHHADSSLAGRTPIFAALGNHEYYEGTFLDGYKQPGSERAVSRYLEYFEFPENDASIEVQRERYYSFVYGPATFVILDVNNNSPNSSPGDSNFLLLGENEKGNGADPDFGIGSGQFQWLEDQLKTAQLSSIFTFVVFHHAPYSVGPHGYPAGYSEGEDYLSGAPLRVLSPYLMQYGVDAVFSGHDEIWERSEVAGLEILPGGGEASHVIHFYDVGTGGDGLRAPESGLVNPYQEFLAFRDAPEHWEEGILLGGGTHYGHLEVTIQPQGEGIWEATMDPVYIFPVWNKEDSAYTTFDRRVYGDRVILQRTLKGAALSSPAELTGALSPVAYPNPFSESVNLALSLDQSTSLTAYISDPAGRIIRIIKTLTLIPGEHTLTWDGKTERGLPAPPGLYILTLLTAEGHIQQIRLLKQD